ncbi:MAG: DHH family phosphoesterase [Patescibacteria group bacterium]
MDYEQALAKAKDIVTNAKDIVIVTHTHPTMDSMGGSLALALGLVSLGKSATVLCADAMTVELSSFIGIDKVSKEFGKKNFVISLDYEDGSIEKVSYNIENKKFNLVIEHRAGHEPFTAEKAKYSYQGATADCIITVDTVHFGEFGKLYTDNKENFAGKSIINIDRHNENTNYGAINLVDPVASSSSELVAEFLATLGVKLTTDIATNLLNAIYSATDSFKHANVTSMAFEVASVCLKAGAKRFGVDNPVVSQPQTSVQPQPVISTPIQQQQPAPTFVAPQVVQPQVQPQEVPAPVVPKTPPPSDWLKPKIFKSSSSIE